MVFLEKMILDNKVMEAKDLKKIEKEIRNEIDNAVTKCKESVRPHESMLFENILSDNTTGFIRNTTHDTSIQGKV